MMKATSVTWNVQVDTLLLVVGMNITLVAAHGALFWIHEKYKWKWSDRALMMVTFLMTMLSWFMAARVPARSGDVEYPKLENQK